MKKPIFLIALSCFTFIACTSGGGSDTSGDDSNHSLSSGGIAKEFATECGTVKKGSVENPVSASRLVSVVSVVDANSLIIRDALGDLLVKLQGLSIDEARGPQAKRVLESLSTGEVYFVQAADDCVATVSGGGTAFVGQLFTASGVSFSEELLKQGLAGKVETSGSCGEEFISGCYSNMREEYKLKSAGQITDFLWKPRAESGYNHGMPVIHANPCNATVFVNGQPLLDFGPANGRCNTSRMYSSCGSFGSNIKVEVIDNASGLPYFNGTEPYVIVPSGCGRYEFKR